ncbi:hypothetical protein ABZ172_28645 [Streptomyces sp. NPDC006296]|uniref:hypothetical protein n=1 Tax=Streptomyces sp. NPDC006296 TaxID=3156746 RepID=UPI0033AB56BE
MGLFVFIVILVTVVVGMVAHRSRGRKKLSARRSGPAGRRGRGSADGGGGSWWAGDSGGDSGGHSHGHSCGGGNGCGGGSSCGGGGGGCGGGGGN